MGIVSIQDLRTDMVLADDVRDCRNRLLMSKGTVLNEKYLRICKMWGVIEADVEGISGGDIYASAVGNFDAKTIAAAEEIVQNRFCHADVDHPAIRELAHLCTLWTAEGKIIDHHQVRRHHCPEQGSVEIKKKPLSIDPKKFIRDDTTLSTLPDIYRQILVAISKPNSSAYDIENVINKDTNLSARLLKIVNSAFYGYPSKIDTLSRAVNIVGTKQLSTLAIGVNITCMFKNISSDVINMEMFWKHSILCGICARIIAGYKYIQNTERMFVAGLLHDIGRLVLYNYLPRESRHAIATATKNRNLLYRVEHDLFDFDHAIIGGDLLEKWHMSMSLEDTVRHHHAPQKSRNRMEASIIHLADIIANAMGIGSSGERFIPSLHPEAWTQLGLTPNILSLTIEQADRQLEDIFHLIYNNGH